MPETFGLDGKCTDPTCRKLGPHAHDVCPECGAAWHGNWQCATCQKAREAREDT
jgi:hypothetical protein